MRIIFMIFLLFCGCNHPNPESLIKTSNYIDLTDSLISNNISYTNEKMTLDSLEIGDTLFIDNTCALLVGPSNNQIEYLKKYKNENAEYYYDNSEATDEITSWFSEYDIPIVKTSAQFIVFRKDNYIINTKKYYECKFFELSYKVGKRPSNIVSTGDSNSLLYYEIKI